MRGRSAPAMPSSPPPVSQPGKPRFASPDSTSRKSSRAPPTLKETNEEFELGSSSTPRASRKSRERTRAPERSPKTPTAARMTPLVEELGRECEKLKTIRAEQKMDLAELRDNLRDHRRGLCAKMRHLFVATGHEDLYDAE